MDHYKNFAALYREFYTYKTDLPFWLHAAREYAHGPILYVGPGTGRLMKELLRDYEIVAVERSAAMCEILERELALQKQNRMLKKYQIYNTDIRQYRGEGVFSLIVIPCNGLTENHSAEDVEDILIACNRLLTPCGCVAVEIDNPESHPCHRKMTVEKKTPVSMSCEGVRRTWVERRPNEHKLILQVELVRSTCSESWHPIHFEYFDLSYDLLEKIATITGFEIIELYGSIKDLSPFNKESKNIAAIIRKGNEKTHK